MSNSVHRKYQAAKDRLQDASDSLAEMRKMGVSARRLERYWREYLSAAVAANNFLKSVIEIQAGKAESDRMWEECKGDPICYYLFQSRNSETHAAQVVIPRPAVMEMSAAGQTIKMFEGDNAHLAFAGNTVEDHLGNIHKLPDFVGEIKDGTPYGVTDKPYGLAITRPYLELTTARSRGIDYPVPYPSGQLPLSFLDFADHYLAFLYKWEKTVRGLIGLPLST